MRGYTRVLVPVVDNGESRRAVVVGCRLAAERSAGLTAVAVIEVPPILPLDAHMTEEEEDARALLAQAEETADSYGVSVTTRILRARRAGSAIVDEVDALGADAVVLGAERRTNSRARAPVFGKTVREVLKDARCRVVLVTTPAAAATRAL